MSNYVAKFASANPTLSSKGGRLFSLKLRNRNAAARFAYIYDSPGAPVDGTVTGFIDIISLAAASQLLLDATYFGASGVSFSNGLTIVFSTADSGTQTTGTAADHDAAAVFAPIP